MKGRIAELEKELRVAHSEIHRLGTLMNNATEHVRVFTVFKKREKELFDVEAALKNAMLNAKAACDKQLHSAIMSLYTKMKRQKKQLLDKALG